MYTNIQGNSDNVNAVLCFRNHCGCATTREMWLFGMVDTSVTLSLGYMELVPQHVPPGTFLHTDEWSAYNGIASLPGVAATVW